MSHVFFGPAAAVERAVGSMVNRGMAMGRSGRVFRALALALGAAMATACTDGPTAPSLLDDAVAQRVMPSVQDTRLRLVLAIENTGVRERIQYDMAQLEAALTARDAAKARYHVRIAGGILLDYHARLGAVVADGPDVGAIALTLWAAAQAVGGGFDISAFR